ncbi:hypothetical protein CRM22_002793 [Opisthorchis felineus]|uniref:Uncharacterized protein n=1 Tax=Opisthorchis felineus TaxID=147828 RepID=A0A4S2M4B8_OPIFE|nr:hypothetical protein CRM22_002793 [Opisthorchis felineus]
MRAMMKIMRMAMMMRVMMMMMMVMMMMMTRMMMREVAMLVVAVVVGIRDSGGWCLCLLSSLNCMYCVRVFSTHTEVWIVPVDRKRCVKRLKFNFTL